MVRIVCGKVISKMAFDWHTALNVPEARKMPVSPKEKPISPRRYFEPDMTPVIPMLSPWHPGVQQDVKDAHRVHQAKGWAYEVQQDVNDAHRAPEVQKDAHSVHKVNGEAHSVYQDAHGVHKDAYGVYQNTHGVKHVVRDLQGQAHFVREAPGQAVCLWPKRKESNVSS